MKFENLIREILGKKRFELLKFLCENADENGLYNGVDYRNYQNVKKEVPAVTHTEKQNVTETYTDYYYCSCGARKDA